MRECSQNAGISARLRDGWHSVYDKCRWRTNIHGNVRNILHKLYCLQTIYSIILHKSVAVRKLQIAILARSSREMSQTIRIDWHSLLSRVRISVRPRNFVIAMKCYTDQRMRWRRPTGRRPRWWSTSGSWMSRSLSPTVPSHCPGSWAGWHCAPPAMCSIDR